MKKILSLAIAAALVAPVAAMAEATVYGKAHMVIQNTSEDDGTDDVDVWSVDSIDSRVGVKGSEDLGGGLKAVYQFEFKVNLDDGSGLGDRNQFVGLAGGFGTVLLGRHDTPLKMSQGKFDQFGDVAGDIKSVIPGEDRLDNVIAYVSPSMGGLSIIGALVSGELGDGAGGELDGPADHISIAGLYKNGPIFASLAYNSYDLGIVADADPSLLRGTLIYKAGMWQAGVMFSSLDLDDAGEDADAYGVSGNVKVGGSGKIKAQFLSGDAPVASAPISPGVKVTDGTEGNDVTQWSLGYEHGLSKRTKVHVGYTLYEEDESDYEETAFFGGLIHKF